VGGRRWIEVTQAWWGNLKETLLGRPRCKGKDNIKVDLKLTVGA